MTEPIPDGLVIERLTRVETKIDFIIDGTNEKLRDHDTRIAQNREDIDDLKAAHTAYTAKVATYAKVGGILTVVGGLLAWFLEHAGTVSALANAVPR